MENIRKELKMKYSSVYPNMVKLYDIVSMLVTQMIDVERANLGRTWMDSTKVQRQRFETLNGRLRLWHGRGRKDNQVIQQAYKIWLNDKNRRMSHN